MFDSLQSKTFSFFCYTSVTSSVTCHSQTMANASRQRHYRHHRGSGQSQRTDGEDNSARAPGPRQKESVAPVAGDCLSPQGRQELREDLVKLLDRAKGGRADLAKDAAVSQEFSQV